MSDKNTISVHGARLCYFSIPYKCMLNVTLTQAVTFKLTISLNVALVEHKPCTDVRHWRVLAVEPHVQLHAEQQDLSRRRLVLLRADCATGGVRRVHHAYHVRRVEVRVISRHVIYIG